jgi:predicted transcriptional regulator
MRIIEWNHLPGEGMPISEPLSMEKTRKRLGVSKMTLMRWMAVNKIIKFHTKYIGGRRYYEFEAAEVSRVKKRMGKWTPGGSYFDKKKAA